MPYNLEKMKKSLESCHSILLNLSRITAHLIKKDYFGLPANSLAVAELVDRVGNLHSLIEALTETKEEKRSEQESVEFEKMKLTLLEQLPKNSLEEQINSVVGTFPDLVRGDARLTCRLISDR